MKSTRDYKKLSRVNDAHAVKSNLTNTFVYMVHLFVGDKLFNIL